MAPKCLWNFLFPFFRINILILTTRDILCYQVIYYVKTKFSVPQGVLQHARIFSNKLFQSLQTIVFPKSIQ